MASGIINGTTSSLYCVSKIEWESTSDVASNKSTVTAKLYLMRTNSYITYGKGWSFDINIGGITTTIKPGYTEVGSSWLLMGTATATISHSDDGSKSISISAAGGCAGTSVASISCSDTVTLDSIARASTITYAADVTLGEKCNVKWTPNSASFRFKLKFSIGEWSYTTDVIHPNTTSPYTYTGYTIPLDAAWQIPDAATGTMAVTLYTYFDGEATTHEGSASSTTFTVTVPTSALPKISSIVLTPVHSLDKAFDGIYIQGCSKVKAEITAETQYGSKIDYCDFTMEGKTYGKDKSYTSAYLANSGSISVVGHAVDSRGYGGYADQPIHVIPYTNPKVQNVTAERCDSEGNPDDSGTYLKISAKRVYSKVESDGVQKNFCSIRYRYKSENGEYGPWETILSKGNTTTDEIITSALLEGTLAIDRTYYVQVGVVDDIGNDPHTTVTIPTDKVYCHKAGARRSFTFGGYVEEDNTFAIASDIIFKATGGIAAIGLYDSNDFDRLIYKTGYYTSLSAPSAAGCIGYPVDKIGVLEVISRMIQDKITGAWWGFAWQTYRTCDGEIHTRSYDSAEGWKPWKQVQFVQQ